MKTFKFFKNNEVSQNRLRLEEMANIPNISEIVLYLLRYCSNHQENLYDDLGVIKEMEYGRFVYASVDYPLNGEQYINEYSEEVNIPSGKLDVLILFTPNDGNRSFYINPVQDYDLVTEEYEGFFYLTGNNSIYHTNETVDNYGND